MRALKRYRKNDIRYCILRDVIVTYGRPFSGNGGVLKTSYRLSLNLVPKDQRDLHDELTRLRNQQFAHSDITYKRPKVADWSSVGRRWFPMSFRGYDFSALDGRVSEIKRLLEGVNMNLQLRIKQFEMQI